MSGDWTEIICQNCGKRIGEWRNIPYATLGRGEDMFTICEKCFKKLRKKNKRVMM